MILENDRPGPMETLKVLIVDDEVPIRQDLRVFDWNAHGAELVGECENGEAALDLCGCCHVDVIISDITMPSMDGIALFSHIRRIYPNIQLIVLTCHKNFSYARQMVQLGVLDYLIKVNITDEDIACILNKARSAIGWNRFAEIGSEKIRHEALTKIISGLRSGNPDYTSIKCRLEKWGVKLRFPWQPIQLFIYTSGENISLFRAEAEEIIYYRDFFDPRMIQFVPYSDKHYLLLPVKNYEEPYTLVLSLKKGIDQAGLYIKKSLNMENSTIWLFAVICKAVPDFPGIAKSLEAFSQYQYRPFYELDIPVISEEDGFFISEGSPEDLGAWEEIQALKNDPEKLLEYISGPLRKELEKKRYAPETVKSFFSRWVSNLFALQGKIDLKEADFSRLTSLEELYNHAVYLISRYLSGRRILHPEIKMAQSYIDAHVDTDLSLAKVSSKVQLSTYYLSRLFHTEVGMPFSEYIAERRIREAEKLLKTTTLKVYEIADKVGFPDYRYFSMVFKKHTGITPKDYKKNEPN